MSYRLAVLGLAAVLGGCASVGEPIPLGQDRYRLNTETHPFRGGSEAALRAGIEKANQYCQEINKTAEITRVGEGSFGRATVHFTCN